MKINLFLFKFFLFYCFFCYGQQDVLNKASNSIKIDELKEKLYKYSSDEFGGRGTPSKGQQLAVEYLQNHYKGLGINSLKNDTYLQAVPLQLEDKPEISLNISDKTFNYYEDYISYANGPDFNYVSEEIVFIGFGIDDPKYSDYKGKDVKGKILVASGGEPFDENQNYLIGGKNRSKWSNSREEIRLKKSVARKKGALGLILIDNYLFRRYKYRHLDSDSGRGEKRMALSNDEENNFQVLLFSEKHKNFLKKDNLKFTMSFKKNVKKFTADNVAAVIEGSVFPNEYIILTAHLDHVGIQDGEIYNGADDDGSGTVAMLEIAEAFALARDQGYQPKRSIIFLHVTAEERGLLGSQYYADYEPLAPLNQTVANLNMDMMGRADPERGIKNLNYIYIIGSDILSDDLHKINMNANNNHAFLELDYRFNDINDPNQFYFRSDHYHFVKNNIPAIFYFSGVHEDYHQPTDTAEKILYDIYKKRVKLIFHTAWELANREDRIELK
tara:strand:+ start:95 stop:1591 length:1497 start_codon:yes stop_codon:yes gene_type:complete